MSSIRAEVHPWSAAAAHIGTDRVLVVCREPASLRHLDGVDGTISAVYSSPDPIEQHATPFRAVYLASCLGEATPEQQRAALHLAVVHLERGGVLALDESLHPALASACTDFGLHHEARSISHDALIYRRDERTNVHDLLWEARSMIARVTAPELAAELTHEDAPLVIDTRTHTDRCRMGVIAGSIHVPRTVLEWHLDPANGYRHPAVTRFDQPMVVVCNGGYSSSLATANLVRLGFANVRDLIGGFRAWVHQGLPVDAPDHAHLDL